MDSQAVVHQLRYSAWASERSLQSAAAVEHEELHRDLGNSFGSVYGTLVHIFQGDAIWCLFADSLQIHKLQKVHGEIAGDHSAFEGRSGPSRHVHARRESPSTRPGSRRSRRS